jgi:hypothetical protein
MCTIVNSTNIPQNAHWLWAPNATMEPADALKLTPN